MGGVANNTREVLYYRYHQRIGYNWDPWDLWLFDTFFFFVGALTNLQYWNIQFDWFIWFRTTEAIAVCRAPVWIDLYMFIHSLHIALWILITVLSCSNPARINKRGSADYRAAAASAATEPECYHRLPVKWPISKQNHSQIGATRFVNKYTQAGRQ